MFSLCGVPLPCVLVAILVCPLATAYSYADTEARERVAKLETKVDILTNELLRLRDVMDRNCRGGSGNSHDESDGNKEEGGEQNSVGGSLAIKDSGLVLKEVRKEELPSGAYRLTIQFWTNVPDRYLVVHWISGAGFFSTSYDYLPSVFLNNVSNGDPGLRETYVDISESSPYVSVSVMTDDVQYYLTLNASFSGSGVEKDIKFELVEIKSSREVVYTRGQNATFLMEIKEGRKRPIFNSMSLNLQTQVMSTYTDLVSVSDAKQYLDYKEYTATVNTSEQASSGLISIYNREEYDDGGAVHDITISRTLHFHPSDMKGTFPDGFLQFVQEPFRLGGEICDVSSRSCFLLCTAFGDNIATFNTALITPDGRVVDLSETNQSTESRLRYTASATILLKSKLYQVGVGRVICEATNGQGTHVNQTVDVRFYEKSTILKNETRIDTPTDESGTTVLICTATGKPKPEIAYRVSSGFDTDTREPDVTEEDGEKVVATLTLTSPPRSASCIARQVVAGEDVATRYSYDIDVDVTDVDMSNFNFTNIDFSSMFYYDNV